jgi:hypothetical protein
MKNFLMALLLFGILAVSGSTSNLATSKRLVFLNFPEKVIKSGELGKQTIKNTSNTRIFFHYLNATGREQVFNLKFEGSFKDFKSGMAIDREPGFAGAKANSSFFKAQRKSIDNPKLSISLPHRATISGIVDATFDQGDKWHCEMGSGQPVEGIKIVSTDNFHKLFKIDLNDKKPYYYRLGDNRNDIIPGDYGFNYNFSIKNKTSSKKLLICYLDPRGGKITGVFNADGKVITTKEINPRDVTKFYDRFLEPNESIDLSYVPTGGYSYPINLKFKLIDA